MLLPFYRAYRAAVRGKVEGMKLAETEVPEAEKAAARAKARARWLFALAELEEPGRKPCLVLVGGLPGSGKSTLARRLRRSGGLFGDSIRRGPQRAGWPRLDRARARRRVGEDFYTEEWNDRTYQECLRRAEEILFEGGRVLDRCELFSDESRRRLFLGRGPAMGGSRVPDSVPGRCGSGPRSG